MKPISNKLNLTMLGSFFCMLACLGFGVGADRAWAASIITFHSDTVVFNADNNSLQEILAELEQQCQIQVKGLDEKLKQPVTLKFSGKSMEDAVKSLLRAIGENNYAFEYAHRNLVKVSVMRTSKHAAALSAPVSAPPVEEMPETEAPPPAPVRTVQVTEIIPNSQAENLGLRPEDLIVEYDGVRIENSQQLIREVNTKAEMDQVEMVVIRDGTPVPMQLKGGQIGVRINTTNLPSEKIEPVLQE